MRVIVTGSRALKDEAAVYDALWGVYQEHGPFQLVHGACSTGADFYAELWHRIAGRGLGCTEEKFPAAWSTRGRAAGPERNERMIEAGADLVLAFPLPEGSGTQMTMRLAREAGIEVREYGHG
ncbi:SLOG family protein [Streptomyces himalayensis]|uniref:DUF2493 domain-containing protein n=1 Tax=Streptomyces himalayensis subsp. himalayensis TaxID=2756131 RepID=A0A7W0DW19_9ACTN|nr:SLOG family protein [Streptomyces himalayensis]MBA2951459.1 DUF2493 domain-containing protein [Streptomyces himalayensis subsp. himalayensis]